MRDHEPDHGEDDDVRGWKRRSTVDSFHHAFEGLYHGFNTEPSLRIQTVFTVLVLLAAWGFGVTHIELLHLLLPMVLVIAAEIFNTAIEHLIDLEIKEWNEVAKVTKDIAAAAVLICAIYALLAGIMIFSHNENVIRLFQLPPEFPQRPHLGPLQIVLVGMLLLAVIVVWAKRATGWRSFLTGGVISGHTALGFLVAASIAFVTRDVAVAALALALALLLAQSRLQADIHKLSEVALGALIGTLLALLLFAWPVVT